MGAAAWAIPVGVLAGLCTCMFVFVWWWFPRHYRKGVQADMDRVDGERRERREREEAHRMADLEAGGDGTGTVVAKPTTTFKYTPQAYTAY